MTRRENTRPSSRRRATHRCSGKDREGATVETIQLLDAGDNDLPDLPHTARLQRKLDEIGGIDFFGASGRELASGLVSGLRARLEPPVANAPTTPVQQGQGRTWATRAGIQVDRITCVWLILRQIDPHATFKFVPTTGDVPLAEIIHDIDVRDGKFARPETAGWRRFSSE